MKEEPSFVFRAAAALATVGIGAALVVSAVPSCRDQPAAPAADGARVPAASTSAVAPSSAPAAAALAPSSSPAAPLAPNSAGVVDVGGGNREPAVLPSTKAGTIDDVLPRLLPTDAGPAFLPSSKVGPMPRPRMPEKPAQSPPNAPAQAPNRAR